MELMEEQKRTYEHGVIQMQNRQLRDNLMIDGMLGGGARIVPTPPIHQKRTIVLVISS